MRSLVVIDALGEVIEWHERGLIPARRTLTADPRCYPSHTDFYQPEGLRRLAERLHSAGVFTLWLNDPPADEFTTALTRAFATATAEITRFDNPYQEREATATTAPTR
ncbi:hypothetical protein [Amycolatopsis cihanbeyliensis]|uniref:hypothetical protein n=1 Tax=Amycolatopsis cihanbeyliensis TaxID=1128664 RepID=UPI001FE52F72|nr:hypothetical protein [Amycolatopsis cihanbeyliensis]